MNKTKEQWILEGQEHYDAQRYEEALIAYQAVLLLDPGNTLIADRAGRILLRLERYEEALAIYEKLSHISSSLSVYLYKGLILQRLGRSIEALDAYRKAHTYGYAG